MRRDWISPSAGTLVIGAFALVLGTLLNPLRVDRTGADVLAVVSQNGDRLFAMAVFYFVASIGLLLGLPSLMSVFHRRPRLAALAAGVFTVGVLGTAGFAVLLIFLRALVLGDALTAPGIDAVAADPAMVFFVAAWIAGFYAGLVLIAVALLVTRATHVWIPLLLLGVVALAPFADALGRVGPMLQALGLAVALTGVAVSAVTGDQLRRHAVPS